MLKFKNAWRFFFGLLLLVFINTSWSAQAKVAKPVGGGPPGGDIEAIVFDLKDTAAIYAATGSSEIFKTTDGGDSWNAINSIPASSALYSLAIEPRSPATIYAGTGHGVYKSVDGGESWKGSSSGLPKAIGVSGILTLAIDPADTQTLYAGTFYRIFKSINGGKSWIKVASLRRFTQMSGLKVLAVDPSHPATVYAAAGDSGLLKSGDRGKHWTVISTSTGAWVDNVWVDPSDSATIYISGGGNMFRSVDAGKHWSRITPPQQTYSFSLTINRKDPATLYAGSFTGLVFKSIDRGDTWMEVGAPTVSIIKTLVSDLTLPAKNVSLS